MFRSLKTCALFLPCLAAVSRRRRETAEISANTSSSVLRSLYFLIKGMMLVSIKKCRLLARQFLNAYQEGDCMHPLADPGSLHASLYWSSYYSLGFFVLFFLLASATSIVMSSVHEQLAASAMTLLQGETLLVFFPIWSSGHLEYKLPPTPPPVETCRRILNTPHQQEADAWTDTRHLQPDPDASIQSAHVSSCGVVISGGST